MPTDHKTQLESRQQIVVGYLFDPTGHLLLGRRSSHKAAWPGCWDIFGGHLEPGEAHDDALMRELNEELGIAITRFAMLSDELMTSSVPPGGPLRRIAYVVTNWRNGTPAIRNEEHSELRWFAQHEIENLADIVPDCLVHLEAAAGMAERHYAGL